MLAALVALALWFTFEERHRAGWSEVPCGRQRHDGFLILLAAKGNRWWHRQHPRSPRYFTP